MWRTGYECNKNAHELYYCDMCAYVKYADTSSIKALQDSTTNMPPDLQSVRTSVIANSHMGLLCACARLTESQTKTDESLAAGHFRDGDNSLASKTFMWKRCLGYFFFLALNIKS